MALWGSRLIFCLGLHEYDVSIVPSAGGSSHQHQQSFRNKCVPICLGILTEFDGAVHSQQDVVALDVPVDHLVGVEEL